jgi:hypothetical protein
MNKLQENEHKVMSLINERLELGRNRYGGDIPINGEKNRDNLKEAIEEALDLSIYLASILIEKQSHLERHKLAITAFMQYWDILPKDAKTDLDKQLKELGL